MEVIKLDVEWQLQNIVEVILLRKYPRVHIHPDIAWSSQIGGIDPDFNRVKFTGSERPEGIYRGGDVSTIGNCDQYRNRISEGCIADVLESYFDIKYLPLASIGESSVN